MLNRFKRDDMQNKSYAEFLKQFIGKKGNAGSSDSSVCWFQLTEFGRGEILEVGEDYVVYRDIENVQCCVPIAAFSVRYVV